MSKHDVFVSVICPVMAEEERISATVEALVRVLGSYCNFHEIILVQPAKAEKTWAALQGLLHRHEGLRVLRLATVPSKDVAISAGLDSAIGDFVVVMDPATDPPELLPGLIDACRASGGLYYGLPEGKVRATPVRSLLSAVFAWYCRRYLHLDVQANSGNFRIFSRQAVNVYLQSRERLKTLRTITANMGFRAFPFSYRPLHSGVVAADKKRTFFDDLDAAFDLLVSTSRHPLRWVSRMGLFVALLNLSYVFYVAGVYLFKGHPAEGWTTLSIQITVMFFFVFLILTVVCEYIGKMLYEAQGGPVYTVLEERTSTVLVDATRRVNVYSDSSR